MKQINREKDLCFHEKELGVKVDDIFNCFNCLGEIFVIFFSEFIDFVLLLYAKRTLVFRYSIYENYSILINLKDV